MYEMVCSSRADWSHESGQNNLRLARQISLSKRAAPGADSFSDESTLFHQKVAKYVVSSLEHSFKVFCFKVFSSECFDEEIMYDSALTNTSFVCQKTSKFVGV